MPHPAWNSPKKMKARDTVVDYYHKVTGLSAIPSGRTCVALCGRQPYEPGYQLHQYVESGFLQLDQYVGVDNDPAIIAFNKEQYASPEAPRFICGDWGKLFPTLLAHRPGFIDLDTTSVANTDLALSCAAQALRLAQPGTLVAYNASMKHVYRYSNPRVLTSSVMEELSKRIPQATLDRWSIHPASFQYKTSRADMQTFLFFRAAMEESCAA